MKMNNLSKFNFKKDTGFTIVETLVAITILMVAIAGPLTIAQRGLTASIYARDQVTASFYAQEAMEDLKRQRGTSVKSDGTWTGISCPSSDTFGKFTRTVTCTNLSKNTTNGASDEVVINITVTWSNGTVSNQVSLIGTIYNILI